MTEYFSRILICLAASIIVLDPFYQRICGREEEKFYEEVKSQNGGGVQSDMYVLLLYGGGVNN
mgnify:CR=1 FL=1